MNDYIAFEIEKEACDFIEFMTDDVNLFRLCTKQGFIKNCEKGDKFAAWWSFKRYEKFPHSLVFLYEKRNELLEKGMGDLQDAFMYMAWCMTEYFDVIVETGACENE